MALPPEIIRLVNACLVRDESPGNRTLHLMAFCGVCQRWREFGREVREPIALDSSTDTQHGPKSTLARFRRSPVAYKRDLFHAASRLLTGYSELSLSGEAINDQMLLNVAVANGPALTSIRLQGTPHVTDAGLCTLISAAPNLRLFSIEEAGPGVVGHFVPALLQHCKQLETLLIEGAESMDWAVLRLSGAWAAAARAASPPPPAAAAAAAAAGSSSQQQQPGGDSSTQQGPSQQAAAEARKQRPVSAPTAARRAQAAPAQQDPVQDSLSPQPSTSAAAGPCSSSSDTRSSRQQPGPSNSMGPSQLQPGNGAQQQQGLPLAPRLSSGSSCSGNSEYSSCQEEGAISDDASSSSAGSSIDAGSDSTSISMPAQAVEELAQQLRHILSGGDNQPATAAAAAAAGAGGDTAPASAAAGPSSSGASQQAAQQEPDGASSSSSPQQQQQRRRRGASKPLHPALRKLRVRLANIDTLQQLLLCVPGLTELQLDGPALSVQAAAVLCPGLRRLSYLVCSPGELDAALLCLGSMRNLRALELEVKGMVLSTEQLRVIGLLPLRELCLDSHAYRQHPSMPRPQYSHLDNDGVKGLVDSICSRMRTELMPLKLSLCGATALKQEAVSALLRLPILASIDTGGCVKLTPMDRMRLVAKVKAGQGLMDKTAAAGAGGAAAGGLRLPHVML